MNVKKPLIALGCLLAVCIAGFALFNAWFYPPHGLERLAREQSAEAWDIAARGFCASSGLTFERVDFIKQRAPSTGGEAYVWGVARCRTADGRQRLAWIYLEWSTKRDLWMRGYTTVLADSDDEIYYTPTFPGQYGRAATALGKIMRENARHVREYLMGSAT
ncbi:hypothetical protein NNJEOMEG_03608 [Fundidesulfovibrio magnetotacticus]|uniref:Uncharacterized protein n=1 Tax=Fundidesulfovibrio magnetotacticus TaxID=2730080 RepID=A0A6V8LY34_9BACT|nr:hypothetical protein [Fundidesulfovibrio magnetotacticus]GFK95740.1 hypothetical protein NNJEOMEG_03608 [Fundidesulfovibrio magnetotacticus]